MVGCELCSLQPVLWLNLVASQCRLGVSDLVACTLHQDVAHEDCQTVAAAAVCKDNAPCVTAPADTRTMVLLKGSKCKSEDAFMYALQRRGEGSQPSNPCGVQV